MEVQQTWKSTNMEVQHIAVLACLNEALTKPQIAQIYRGRYQKLFHWWSLLSKSGGQKRGPETNLVQFCTFSSQFWLHLTTFAMFIRIKDFFFFTEHKKQVMFMIASSYNACVFI